MKQDVHLSEVLLFSFRLGFAGNHPFRTLSTCSLTSFMLQKQLKEVTPNNADNVTEETSKVAIREIMPVINNADHIFSTK